jgi:6-pyruvoyltetrahydropterin/6-carboxytetrahydropterin synthase
MESWSIKVHKDYLKFSAAHFLIFPDGTAERLHGHNYKIYVELHAGLDEHGLVLNFQDIKPCIRGLADELDEHVLLPGEHPGLQIKDADGSQIEVRYQDRFYSLPADEVIVLPISNSSAENLAGYLARRLIEVLRRDFSSAPLQKLILGVEETPGQQGVVTIDL